MSCFRKHQIFFFGGGGGLVGRRIFFFCKFFSKNLVRLQVDLKVISCLR